MQCTYDLDVLMQQRKDVVINVVLFPKVEVEAVPISSHTGGGGVEQCT